MLSFQPKTVRSELRLTTGRSASILFSISLGENGQTAVTTLTSAASHLDLKLHVGVWYFLQPAAVGDPVASSHHGHFKPLMIHLNSSFSRME